MLKNCCCIYFDMEKFVKTYNVSRETIDKLSCYINLLKEWQNKFNLVSSKSLENVWQRHIADSYQLFQYIDNNIKTIYDIGSGAGFPALVLAIVAQEKRPDICFKLIESITKKTVYLNAVKSKLNLDNVEILNERSESLNLPPADMITARAVAALDKLFSFVKPLSSNRTVFFFPKGVSYRSEIDDAVKNWSFDCVILKNEVEPNGVILKISNLRKKK